MEEIGRVVEIRGVMAKVVVTPKGECSRCAAATFCSALTGGDRIIEARNPLRWSDGVYHRAHHLEDDR